MKYLLFSDIHGCLPALEKVLDFFEAEHCDMMCIMGDIINYGPRNRIPEGIDPKGIVERLNALADKIVAVRGNCDAEVDQMLLDFPIMETYALLVDGGKRYLLTHGHVYNKENMPKGPYEAMIYGHSHLWELSHNEKGQAIVNTAASPSRRVAIRQPLQRWKMVSSPCISWIRSKCWQQWKHEKVKVKSEL